MSLTPEQFRYALANAIDPDESARLYARYVIPAPPTWSFDTPAGGALEVACVRPREACA